MELLILIGGPILRLSSLPIRTVSLVGRADRLDGLQHLPQVMTNV